MVNPQSQHARLQPVNGRRARRASADIHYPEGDDRPLAETQAHGEAILHALELLQDRYADREDVYVWTNLNLYYIEHNRRRYVAPDVFVAIGVPREPKRRVYQLWREPAPPTVVFEMTSLSTRGEDEGRKKAIYARIGVRELYLFDPLGEYLRPALRGFVLVDGAYQPLPAAADGGLTSEALGLRLIPGGDRLAFEDAGSGQRLRTRAQRAAAEAARAEEAEARADAAEARATAEAAARQALERRLAELLDQRPGEQR